MTLIARTILALGLPLRTINRKAGRVERLLRLALSPAELESVRQACLRCNVRLGHYYHWYLEKLITARQLRSMNGARIMKHLAFLDTSNYEVLTRAHETTGNRGLIVAIPHHAHYILSIVAMAEHLRKHRKVLIFYGSPATHSGNELFDEVYRAVFQDESSNVNVIHDTRAGLARALRGLDEGAAVVIMPDVHKHEADTYLVPFCGRPLNVMLGTAALARKTGASIVPAISRALPHGPRFETYFAEPLAPGESAIAVPDHDAANNLHKDYTTTSTLFQIFEREMSSSIIHWQYVRTHYGRHTRFPFVQPGQIEFAAELLFNDARLRNLKQPAFFIHDT